MKGFKGDDKLVHSVNFSLSALWDFALQLPSKQLFDFVLFNEVPIPVAARSKAWVCGRSLAGIAGSNTAGVMDVCLLWVLCVVR
jgi:hypothetical protein